MPTRAVSAPPVAIISEAVAALAVYEAVMAGQHSALRAARVPKF